MALRAACNGIQKIDNTHTLGTPVLGPLEYRLQNLNGVRVPGNRTATAPDSVDHLSKSCVHPTCSIASNTVFVLYLLSAREVARPRRSRRTEPDDESGPAEAMETNAHSVLNRGTSSPEDGVGMERPIVGGLG